MVNIKISSDTVRSNIFDKNLLKPKNILYPEFWSGGGLNKEISEKLLEIAKDVISSMEINADIKDIIITGSICSFNWHKHSDVDLHIVLKFDDIDENFELVKRMLDQSRINWNKVHNILISDKEVELYFQDEKELHESNGVWSLIKNTWIVQPIKTNPSLDLKNSEKKAETLAKAVEHIAELVNEKDYEEAYEYSSKVKYKISKMRKSGLEKEGIYSPENLAFKMLRYGGYLERLSFLKTLSYDKMMSLDILSEAYVQDYFNNKVDSEYLEFDGHPQATLEKMLDESEKAPWD